jgi:PPOX class probable F420-dependent enzyme
MLQGPSPAALTTYRRDGSALTSPVWYRWTGEAFEVVIAADDVKVQHLTRDPRCVLVVFEVARPFRGVEVRGEAELLRGDVTEARKAIASRYLGVDAGTRFAAERSSEAVLVRLSAADARAWSLARILPD